MPRLEFDPNPNPNNEVGSCNCAVCTDLRARANERLARQREQSEWFSEPAILAQLQYMDAPTLGHARPNPRVTVPTIAKHKLVSHLYAAEKPTPKLRIRDGWVYWRRVPVIKLSRGGLGNDAGWRDTGNYRRLITLAKSEFEYKCGGIESAKHEMHKLINTRTSGSLMEKFLRNRILSIDTDKKPKTNIRHFGIEIEFLSEHSGGSVKREFAKAHLQDYVTYHTDSSVGSDGDCGGESCDGGGECGCDIDEGQDCEVFHCSCVEKKGHEICVCVNSEEFESVISRVCTVLNDKLDASVDKTCGLHVHLDGRRRSKKPMYHNLVSNVDFIMSLLPGSRRRSSYCRPNDPKRDMDDVISGDDRYWAINPQSIEEHNTIEVRCHSGTTDPVKIVQWIKLLSFLAYKRRSRLLVESFIQLVEEGLELQTVMYFASRYEKFKGHKGTNWKPKEQSLEKLINESNSEVA